MCHIYNLLSDLHVAFSFWKMELLTKLFVADAHMFGVFIFAVQDPPGPPHPDDQAPC